MDRTGPLTAQAPSERPTLRSLWPNAVGWRPRVLVAEDDSEMRRVLVRVFTREGLVVSEARDGLELVEIATAMLLEEGAAPELVVTDVHMPGRSGIEALRALGTTLRPAAILVITAFGDEATHREAVAVGAAGVLNKPFERDALIEAVVRLRR